MFCVQLDVLGINEDKAILNSATVDEGLNVGGDVDECPSGGDIE